MMTRPLIRRRMIGALLPGLLSACASNPADSSIDAGFDAARTVTATRAMADAFRAAPWRSYRALGVAMGARFAEAAPAAALSASVPRLPYELRGRTLVYDPLVDRYVVDDARAGAPANGVRFVLYNVDSVTARPVVAQEIGFAQISDEGDALPSGVAMRLQVITGGERRLDYFVRADGSDTTGMLVAAGVLGDGLEGLRFEVGLASVRSTADSVAMRFAFELPAHGFAATGGLRNVSDGAGSMGEAAVAVRAGANLIELNARGDNAAMEAVFRVNGHPFARVVGEPANPVIHGEGGRALSEGERQALAGIMGLVGGVFGVVQALLQPAGVLLGVGQ